MKILILTISLFALSFNIAGAKTFKIKSTAEEKLANPVIAEKDDREEIEAFDFQRLFKDAEQYYKSAKSWSKLKCEPKNGFICAKHTCKKRPSYSHIMLDKKDGTITRCEGKRCEQYPAEFKQTGVFYNIQTEGPIGTLIRVLGDSRYKEITTVGLDAYIANGNCEVVAK